MSEAVAVIETNHTNTSETKIKEGEVLNFPTAAGGTSSEAEKGKETKEKKVGNGIPKDQVKSIFN